MNIARTITTAASVTGAAGLLAILTACGQAGQPVAGSPSSAGTSVAASSRPATSSQSPAASQPAAGTSSPSAPAQVLSFRLAYPWHWPNDAAMPAHVTHAAAVPPVPELVQIRVGSHPAASGERAYERISFTFTDGFPSYRLEFVGQLISDPGGKVIPLGGEGVLDIVFTGAQAHSADGTKTSVISQPGAVIGFQRMAGYALGGDFEGVVSYGVGITWPAGHAGQQLPVRAYEEEMATGGQHRYTVAIDIDASNTL